MPHTSLPQPSPQPSAQPSAQPSRQFPEVAPTVLDELVALAREVQPGEVAPSTPMIDLGFDSLASLELATRIEDDLDVPCTIEDVLDAADLEDLAATLLARRGSGQQ